MSDCVPCAALLHCCPLNPAVPGSGALTAAHVALSQVILTGSSHHVVAAAPAPGAEPTPAEAAAQGAVRKATGAETEPEQPLRVYWEYLSYLFLRVPALSAEEDLEKGYRDYLQVGNGPTKPPMQCDALCAS